LSIVAVFDGDSETGMHHLVKDPDKQLRQAVDGFRQVMKRGGLVGADRAYRSCGPAHVAAPVLRNPSLEQSDG
jgi:hypothetical protein